MKQDIANQNVNTRNQQQTHNKNLAQQQFENELKKRQGQAGISSANAAAAGQDSWGRANANNQFTGGLLSAGGAYLGSKKG
jgi:hypothetical protein